MICMSLKLSFQTLLRENGGSVKRLNIGTYANGFISSSEALKSVIWLFLLMWPLIEVLTYRRVKLEQQQTCLWVNPRRITNQAEDEEKKSHSYIHKHDYGATYKLSRDLTSQLTSMSPT